MKIGWTGMRLTFKAAKYECIIIQLLLLLLLLMTRLASLNLPITLSA